MKGATHLALPSDQVACDLFLSGQIICVVDHDHDHDGHESCKVSVSGRSISRDSRPLLSHCHRSSEDSIAYCNRHMHSPIAQCVQQTRRARFMELSSPRSSLCLCCSVLRVFTWQNVALQSVLRFNASVTVQNVQSDIDESVRDLASCLR